MDDVISKEGQLNVQVRVGGEVVYVNDEEERGEDGALGDPGSSRDGVGGVGAMRDVEGPVAEEGTDPVPGQARDTCLGVQFEEEEVVGDPVESLDNVEEDHGEALPGFYGAVDSVL
jgi:hypothetical protein